MLRYFVTIFSLFSFLACHQMDDTKRGSTLDSTNGISESEFKAHFIDSARKKMNQDIAFSDTASQSNCPVKVIVARPITKEYSNYKDVSLTYKNISNKTIEAIKFKWYGLNAFGEPADMGVSDGIGSGFDDDKLRAGKTVTNQWNILSKDLKKIVKAWAYEVVFEDGTKWTAIP